MDGEHGDGSRRQPAGPALGDNQASYREEENRRPEEQPSLNAEQCVEDVRRAEREPYPSPYALTISDLSPILEHQLRGEAHKADRSMPRIRPRRC
jgi:hypothetical protein